MIGRSGKRVLQWRWRRATAPLRALPDLIAIGAQKGGTTSLFHYLAQHPQVLPPSRGEVHFFDHHFGEGEFWYRAHLPFRAALRGGRISFETSPLYLFHPLVPARIARLIPRVKLVAILRDPTERAISHYFMSSRKGREPLPLKEALASEEKRLARPLAERDYGDPAFRHFSYKLRGHYAEQLERYRALFPPEQLLVLSSEDLFARPEPTLQQLFAFAGVDPEFKVADLEARNAGANRTGVDPSVRAELDAYFRPHNQRLASLLGRDFGWGSSSRG